MKVLLLILATIAGLIIVIAFFLYLKAIFLSYRARYVNRKLSQKRYERIRPLLENLQVGGPVNSGMYLLLPPVLSCGMGLEYYTLIKASESKLANWLEFPTVLNAIPDEIEHVKRVSVDYDGKGSPIHYEVFKYRVNSSHRAAGNEWVLGVVGPYFDGA